MIGNRPNAAPSRPAVSACADGHRVDDDRDEDRDDERDAARRSCAVSLSPPSSTNSVTSGSAAKSELATSESPTGSNTCSYMRSSSLAGAPSDAGTSQVALHYAPSHVRVALFITCFNDTLFPGTGARSVELLERLGLRGRRSPRSRPAAGRCTSTRATQRRGGRAGAALRAGVRATPRRSSRPSASCVGDSRWPATRLARAVAAIVPRVRADRVPRRRARGRGRRRVVPAPRRPTTRPATRCGCCSVGDRPAAAAARGAAGSTSSSSRTPQECCGFGGTFAVKNADTSMAMLSDKLRHVLDTRAEVCTAADNSCLMHIGGALRTPADRRAHDAPGRDPGGARNDSGFPARRARGAAPTPSCGATSARRRRRSAPSALRAVAELPDWEALRDAGAAIKARAMATLPEQLERLEASVHARRRHRALGARRRRGERDRRRDRRAATARAR